jgi:beta-glucosidase
VSCSGRVRLNPSPLERLEVEGGWSLEILITENGIPDNVADCSNPTADEARTVFLHQHLQTLHQAIREGSRMRGYWSLLDNFEWTAGYSQRWGLVRVDFDTLARSPKTSASWYSATATSNSIPSE